jgi:hypothetical protein
MGEPRDSTGLSPVFRAVERSFMSVPHRQDGRCSGAHPEVALLVYRKERRHGFGWIGWTSAFGAVVRKM